ncbi:hypothetical protein EA472_07280 [Natrarchaeobius oligotrophus]|uniref:Glycosyltransferase RgtA/B/C/D-like domain-containing protein n=2 Tax=Natrarchaeobius TaxID=2501796 RepID=A0A3N6MEJ6_NATCH|nr:hypothetical protein EA472_07280 [Natrarchaeobius chitinivorans]
MCFVLSGTAAAIAVRNGAIGYEIDVYRSTPRSFWLVLASSICASTLIAFSRVEANEPNRLALVATAYSVLLVVSLPLLRRYYFVGEGDMLTHLGWTRELLAGTRSATDLLYPAVHLLGSALAQTTALSVRRSLMLLPVIFVGLFVVFVALVVRRIDSTTGATTLGVFFALFLLPVNHVTIHVEPSPRNFALFSIPFVLFAVLLVLIERTIRTRLIALLLFAGLLVFHPMYTVVLTVFLVAVAVVLWLYQSLGPVDGGSVGTLFRQSLLLGGCTWVWIRFENVFANFFSGLLFYVVEGAEVAGDVSQRGSSVAEVGGTLATLFLKLFSVSLVVGLVVAVFTLERTLALVRRPSSRTTPDGERDLLLSSFVFGLVPIGGMMLLFLVTNRTTMFFRFAGFVMVIFTIVGAVATGRYVVSSVSLDTRFVLVPCLLVLVGLSLLIVHPSGYIHQDTEHVTEADTTGYELVFQYEQPTVRHDHVRSHVSRYGHAINGPAHRDRRDYYHDGWRRGGSPDNFASQDLPTVYPSKTYLTISSADEKRESELYDGFRFTEDDFAYLERETVAHRVHTTGDFRTYYVAPDRADDQEEIFSATTTSSRSG